jgi:hypothetical protein
MPVTAPASDRFDGSREVDVVGLMVEAHEKPLGIFLDASAL